jgi:hypothetical protein
MSFAKTHLKAARDGISKKDYAAAKKEASLVLDYEPDNYNACGPPSYIVLGSPAHNVVMKECVSGLSASRAGRTRA